MKNFWQTYTLVLLLCTASAFAQVGIGTAYPEGAFDVALGQAFVYPRITLTDLNTQTITTPSGGSIETGTMVYNTKNSGTDENAIYIGLYLWNGSQWIAQFDKKDNKIFVQNASARTGHEVGQQGISFDLKTFTPKYYGAYKISVTVHFGAGQVDLPLTANPDDQYTNFNAQEGSFSFSFNNQNHSIGLKSFSGNNDDKLFDGGVFKVYENSYNQAQFSFVETTLEAGVAYDFDLTFDQLIAEGFISDGAFNTDGSGHITLNDAIGCTVEINYIGN